MEKVNMHSNLVWIVLISLSLFAFLLGWLELVNLFFVAVLLVSMFIKGQLVIDYFMDLRHVQAKWRFIPTLWLFVVILSIAVAYYLPAAN